jgi:hypothetical protein
MVQIKLNSGSIFLAKENPDRKSSVKTLEEILEEECLKRNKSNKKNPKKSLHASWKIRIKREMEEAIIKKKGWKGTKINFTQIGTTKAVVKQQIIKEGKKFKEKHEHWTKRKSLKKSKNVEWGGSKITF